MGESTAAEGANGAPGSGSSWIELAGAAAGVLLLGVFSRWPVVDARWAMAVFAGVAAGVSLLAAGSLSAVAYAIRKAAGFQGFDADESGRPGSSVTRRLAERFRRATASLNSIPARTRLALELAVYWAGVAAALVRFVDHAAGAGWAASAAGLATARLVRRGSLLRPLVFVLGALPAAVLSLAWVKPDASFMIAHATSATLVMATGAAAMGASVVAMRWRASERLSVPLAVALTVWSLTWFFVRGEGFGHEPSIVALGVGVGAALAGIGFLVCAVDGPAAGVVLFFIGRVYAFLGWTAAIPFILATVIGWRPRPPWRRKEAHGTRHGPAFEIATGALPFALAAGYFTFESPIFLSAYAAYCAAVVAVGVSRLVARFPKARVCIAAGVALLLPIMPFVHYAGEHAFRVAGAAVVGALLAWGLDALMNASAKETSAADWRKLPVPVKRATLGAVASALAACMAALALAAGEAPT